MTWTDQKVQAEYPWRLDVRLNRLEELAQGAGKLWAAWMGGEDLWPVMRAMLGAMEALDQPAVPDGVIASGHNPYTTRDADVEEAA